MNNQIFALRSGCQAVTLAALSVAASFPAMAFDIDSGSGIGIPWDGQDAYRRTRPLSGRLAPAPNDIDQEDGIGNFDGRPPTIHAGFTAARRLSGQLRPTPSLSLTAYYQDGGRQAYGPPTGDRGSSLSGPGGDNADPSTLFFRAQELNARDNGEWGIAARYRSAPLNTEFGIYWIQKQMQTYLHPGSSAEPILGQLGELPIFPESVRLLGASFVTTWNKASLASEVQLRRNISLASLQQDALLGSVIGAQNKPFYTVSNSVHLQLSAAYPLPATTLWHAATVKLEVGRQRRTLGGQNSSAVDPLVIRQTRAVQVLFTPTWFEALPNLDVSLPVSLSYSPKAQAPLPGLEEAYRGGRFSFGASAVYQKVWNADLRYMHYFGEPESSSLLKDRNFLWISIQRNF